MTIVSDLVDLYNLENMIKEKSVTPFSNLNAILSFNRPDLQISNIKWEAHAQKLQINHDQLLIST